MSIRAYTDPNPNLLQPITCSSLASQNAVTADSLAVTHNASVGGTITTNSGVISSVYSMGIFSPSQLVFQGPVTVENGVTVSYDNATTGIERSVSIRVGNYAIVSYFGTFAPSSTSQTFTITFSPVIMNSFPDNQTCIGSVSMTSSALPSTSTTVNTIAGSVAGTRTAVGTVLLPSTVGYAMTFVLFVYCR